MTTAAFTTPFPVSAWSQHVPKSGAKLNHVDLSAMRRRRVRTNPTTTQPTASGGASSTHQRTHSQAPPLTRASLAARILTILTNLFPAWVLLGATAALLHPPSFLWFPSNMIVPTLSVIMLGMGLTTPPSSLTAILRTPQKILLGTMSQYTLMPLLATILARLLKLPAHLAAGLILVGVCPGGAASNVVCLLAGADVALSVVLTLCSTLLSVLLIPTLMSLLAGTLVPVNPTALLLSTAQVVLLPILTGSALQKAFPRAVKNVTTILPLVSVLGVTAICGGIVAANASSLSTLPKQLVLAVALMHSLGGLFGYFVARAFRLETNASRTVSIEVMMQNSSLAVSLAAAHFANPLTAVPGAISATMHSVFGSILAGVWRLTDSWKAKRRREVLSKTDCPVIDEGDTNSA